MNEQLQEFYRQAIQSTNTDECLDMPNKQVQRLILTKYAELIGKEYLDCIDIMEKIANSSNASIPENYDKYTYLKTLDDLKGLLKVHFGVEG